MTKIPPLDKIRLFITDEDDRPRSSVWFVTQDGKGVYASTAATGATMKLSLHPPGGSRDGNDCQFGHPRGYAQKEADLGLVPMKPIRWKRPTTPTNGAGHVASIIFPTDHLGLASPPGSQGRRKYALPMAPPGQATEVGLFFSKITPAELKTIFSENGWDLLFGLDFPGGDYVLIGARHRTFPELTGLKVSTQRQANPLSGSILVADSDDLRAIHIAPPMEQGDAIYLSESGPILRSP